MAANSPIKPLAESVRRFVSEHPGIERARAMLEKLEAIQGDLQEAIEVLRTYGPTESTTPPPRQTGE